MFIPIFFPDVHHRYCHDSYASGPKYRYKEKLVTSTSFKNVIFTFKLKPQPPAKVEKHSWIWHVFHSLPGAPHYDEHFYVYYSFINKDDVEKMVADADFALEWIKQKVKKTEDTKDRYSDYTGFKKAYSDHYEGIDPDHLYIKDMKLILDKYEIESVHDCGFDSWYKKDTSERIVEENY